MLRSKFQNSFHKNIAQIVSLLSNICYLRRVVRRRGWSRFSNRPKAKLKAALCVTCLIDQFYPEVGEAVVKVLRGQGVDVSFPEDQTCCGQIAFNGGFRNDAADVAQHFMDLFENEEHVVVPSGSCTSMIKIYYQELFKDDPEQLERAKAIAEKTYEFSDFLVNVVGQSDVGASSYGLITYHDACHLLRELGISKEPRELIGNVDGVEIQEINDSDSCCGFGGLFSVKFPDISAAILEEKIKNIIDSGAGTLVANDCGCLMQIRGAMQRKNLNVRAVHIAELLAEGE
jgi:L-lactate dehydrogenase complex protein LldE